MEGGTEINMISVEPLLALGKLLGISQEVWENSEELNYISYYDENINRDKAIMLNVDQISILKREYGDAVRCIFRTIIDYQVLDIREDIDDNRLEVFREETEGYSTLHFDFKLDKTKLILNKFGDVSECNLFIFFFTNALLKCLNSSLGELERSFWESKLKSTYKVLLFILDHDIWLDGTYIAIIGSQKIDRWRDAIYKPSKEDNEKIQNMYDICQRNLHWQAQWLGYLTPLHFKVNGEIPYDDSISKALLINQVNLIILYTAYRTQGIANNPISSTYAGANQSVELMFEKPRDKIGTDVVANAPCLMEILEWVYDNKWSGDHLRFIHIVATQYLHGTSPVARYELFLSNAINIFDQLKWQWQAFMEDKVDYYMSHVLALEDYVANTIKEYNNQISNMIKSLSDTMLAAVGVSIGAIILGLSRNNNPIFLTFSLLIYAGYVLIFPLYYNMTHQWEQYEMLRNNFEERQKTFAEKLYPDKVKKIVGLKISESQNKFEWWFFATIGAYVLVFLVFFGAAMWASKLV
jgi:hypothetical protein